MFRRDPEKAAQREAGRAEKKQQREEWAAKRKEEKEALTEWRLAHAAEKSLNQACMLRSWPGSEFGRTDLGPVLGGTPSSSTLAPTKRGPPHVSPRP
jgi:hypothetical protein